MKQNAISLPAYGPSVYVTTCASWTYRSVHAPTIVGFAGFAVLTAVRPPLLMFVPHRYR